MNRHSLRSEPCSAGRRAHLCASGSNTAITNMLFNGQYVGEIAAEVLVDKLADVYGKPVCASCGWRAFRQGDGGTMVTL